MVALRGPKTDGPMAPEIPLDGARPAEFIFEKQVIDFMQDAEVSERDKRWFKAKDIDLPAKSKTVADKAAVA